MSRRPARRHPRGRPSSGSRLLGGRAVTPGRANARSGRAPNALLGTLARAFELERPAGRWTCAQASGALLAVAGRPWGVGWLAAVAFVPLLMALRREPRPLAAALQCAAAALPAGFVVYEAIGPLAPMALPPLALAATLPFALAGLLTPRLRRAVGGVGTLLAFPLLWVAAEALPAQAWLLGRYATPLFVVGYSQAGLPAMQLARFGGVEAVSLAVLAANGLLALALLGRARWAAPALVALGLAVAAAAAPAHLAAPESAAAESAAEAAVASPDRATGRVAGASSGHVPGRVAVRIVQEASPDAAYAAAALLPEARAALVRTFVRDSLAVPLPEGPSLTVWPEGALPGPLPATGATGLEPLLAGLGPTLAGGPARVGGGVANAAYAWQGGRLRHVYDKRRLAPGTEDGLVAGTRAGMITLGGVRVAPLICFEAAFPALARRAAAAGAQLLVVLTNDGFGRYLGTPVQHLRLARFRAVETGRPLAFASNAGPSAVIDRRGRVLARSPQGRAAALVATPRLAAGPTPYLRWGDWPGTVALAGAGLLALVTGARGGAARP